MFVQCVNIVCTHKIILAFCVNKRFYQTLTKGSILDKSYKRTKRQLKQDGKINCAKKRQIYLPMAFPWR